MIKQDTPNKVVVAEFEELCKQNTDLFEDKNLEYGNAIVQTGVVGATVELIGAVARLKQLVLKAPDHGRTNVTSIINVARDAHNYANILLLMLDSDNWTGE